MRIHPPITADEAHDWLRAEAIAVMGEGMTASDQAQLRSLATVLSVISAASEHEA